MGRWVSFLDGSYGSWVDALTPMTHLHIYRKRADMPPKKKVKVLQMELTFNQHLLQQHLQNH